MTAVDRRSSSRSVSISEILFSSLHSHRRRLLLGLVVFFSAGVLYYSFLRSSPVMKVGGVGEAKPATEEVHGIVASVRADLEAKAGHAFAAAEAEVFATQVVAGTNFFVKIHTGDGAYVHARIYRDLQGHVSVHSIQTGKSKDDALVHF